MSRVIKKFIFHFLTVFHTLHKKFFSVDNFYKEIMIEIYRMIYFITQKYIF
jgi:hypothetical protein